jgi:beta-glucosidase
MNMQFFHTRRGFLGLAGATTAALLAGGCKKHDALSEARGIKSNEGKTSRSFPSDFMWGTATASCQIEGAADIDGKGPSIWDAFSRQPGAVDGGDTPEGACDFYHRFPDDVKLMQELGVKHFRFSISWPRVLPEGTGRVNELGLDFYKRLTDTLLSHGITPHATLYHWDLPQSLQKRYAGWQSRRIVEDFGGYASLIGKHLGDRIRDWMTLNEISSFTRGSYGVGKPATKAPGITLSSERELNQLVHHTLLAHGTACLALRASCSQTPRISIAENYTSMVPVTEDPSSVMAACKAFRRENGGILMPILTGSYDPGWMEDQRDSLPEILPGDMELIHQPLDSLGSNCYTGRYVCPSETPKGFELIPWSAKYPVAGPSWNHIVPESIYWAVRLVGEAAGRKDLSVFVSENGCADNCEPDASGLVRDIDRIMYYRAYLTQLSRAVDEGYPVTGYFPWSLLDNFEWARGYSQRFGLVRVDYSTQRRIPKLSFSWYRGVIAENRVV